MFQPFLLLWSYRKIILSVTINDIKAKYAGSTLGIMWSIIYPILFLSVYFIVYIVIFKVRLEMMNTFDYVMVIFCGLIPWFGFAESIGIGVNSVTSNASLIKNTLFPIELIPVKVVFSSLLTQIIGFVMLIVVLSIKGIISNTLILIPLVLLLQVLFSIGLVWILASLNVFFRDLGQIISVILILLMMVSPIAYTSDMISQQVLKYMKINPLYYIITAYRKIIMFNEIPALFDIVVLVIMSFLTFIIGYYVFSKLKVVFTDYV